MNLNHYNIGIVILSWNDPVNTFELVSSIVKSDYNNYDIIIVDNNSSVDNFNNLLDQLNKNNYQYKLVLENEISIKKENLYKNIYVIRSTEIADIKYAENLGVSRGYNKGINFALKNNYDFVFKLDCDFIISENLISGLVETFKQNSKAVAVSPKVYYHIKKKTKIIWWKGVNFTKNYFRFQRTGLGAGRKDEDKGQFKGIFNSEGICGCCVMLKSDTIRKTGLLDIDFFFGPEDIEHAFRLKKYGELLVNLNYHAYHKVSQSIFISGVKKRIYYETIGWLTLIRKVCNFRDRILGYAYFIIRGISHLLRYIYKNDKDAHTGFVLGLIDYFFRIKK